MTYDTTRQAVDAPESHLWTGMMGFGSFMLLLIGGFHVLGGFIAVLEDRYYEVSSSQLLIAVDYTWWGIAHMALGVFAFLTGIALFYRKSWSRAATMVVASLSAVTNLTFLSAAPGWYGLLIALDFLVIFAVAVHFDDEPE
jgi:hypothetical protein